MIALLVALTMTLNGVWLLPTKEKGVQLNVMQTKPFAGAFLRVPTKKGTIAMPMVGSVKKAKCGTFLELHSRKYKFAEGCYMKTSIISCGKVSLNSYTTQATMILGLFCKDQQPRIMIDDLSGKWLRIKVKKRAAPKKDKSISI